ncbi:SDR family NAD(P)-dependent oxidoreductase [Actinomadura sp. NTSP31]|uniref:SDR family NAD(P)-dependent oxidoreductase n=1 Tax=Actinomadura sp. NTSP31 TaxID=1735447 RepID=UPI0035C00BFC
MDELSLHGRTCVVTGASSGIGLETARALAARGAVVGMVCRSAPRGEAAMRSIRDGLPEARLRLFLADLSSQRDVRRVAAEVEARLPELDVLVNNAGLVSRDLRTGEDGVELQFATNYLAVYLLSTLLTGTLVRNAPARIVNVASGVHGRARMDWDDLAAPRSYNAFQAYARSKFAVIAHTAALGRRLAGTGVTVNAVEPGLTRTALLDDAGVGAFRLVRRFLRFAPTADEAARHCVRLACDPELASVTGAYFRRAKQATAAAPTRDPETQARLERLSAELTGSTRPSTRERNP